MEGDSFRNYLRSLVSEETSSDEEPETVPPPRKRHNGNNRKKPKSTKTATPIELGEDDPQEGTSSGPALGEDDPQEGTSTGPGQPQTSSNLENDPNKREKVGNDFEKGTIVFSDNNVAISVKSVANQRNTRFRVDDHLYQINIKPHRRTPPLLLSLERAIREALFAILLKLKHMYGSNLHHQIYLTIIEQSILHGLNTGNYEINSPANIIINRVMTILHSYLKSKQTLRLNNSFKIQIKVLSHRHMQHLVSTKPKFQKHLYHIFLVLISEINLSFRKIQYITIVFLFL